MKRFLFLITLLTLLGGANSVKAIVLGDEITSLDGITDGTMFIISDDGSKVKYFYNSVSGANENKNANVGDVPADAYCFFTLEKYNDGDIPNTTSPADNIYRIKITNAAGTGYPYGSNGGCYLNSILTFGDVVISGPEAGWSNEGNVKTNALWYVTYDAEKGFSFQNVYRANSLKSWLAIGNDFVADQQYLKLYSKSNDPLAPQKAALEAAIALGNKYSSIAKTSASWNALQEAISDGTTVLNNPGSESDDLTSATTAINNAIAGLKLQPGYTNLTQNMFKHWNDNYVPTIASSTSCAYVLRESTGQPYGDGNVQYLNFADVTDFSKLIVVGSSGTPRIMLNRLEVGNGGGDGNGGGYIQITDAFEEGKKEVDLTAYDYAHINAIKGYNGNVTVSDMLLYRTLTVGGEGYATFGSLTKNAKPNGVKAYAAVYNSGTGMVDIEEVTNVPAGKGVIIEAAEGSYAPTFDVAADDITSDLKVSNGTVVGDGSTIYVLNKVGGKVGFYLLKSGNKLEAGKAYLEITDTPARGFIGIDGADVLTGISTVNQAKVTKTGKIYNLNGQIVSKPTKGLYIVDGKVVSF